MYTISSLPIFLSLSVQESEYPFEMVSFGWLHFQFIWSNRMFYISSNKANMTPTLSLCVCVFVLVSLEIFYHSICALFLCLFIANPFLHFFFPIIRNHAFDNFLCKSISRRYKHLISLRPIKFFVCVINKIYIYF